MMIFKGWLSVFFALTILLSCQDQNRHELLFESNNAALSRIHDSLYIVNYTQKLETDSLILPYPVFRMDVGDVNEDGQPEILLGLNKATHFDSVSRNRLFIYKIYENKIRPLWLGSSIGIPLIDFKTVEMDGKNLVKCLVKDRDTYAVALYAWRRFGLQFKRFTIEGVRLEKAKRQFNL